LGGIAMNKKVVFLLFVISSIVIFIQPIQAMMCWDDMMGWFGGKGHKHGGETQKEEEVYQPQRENLEGKFYVDLKNELDLTNSQVKALDELGKEYEKEKVKKASNVDKMEKELAMLQTKRDADMDEIKKKIDEIENLRKEMRWDYVNAVERAKKLLTDEQLDRLSRIGKGNAKKIEKNEHGEGTSHEDTTTGHEGMGGHHNM